MTVFPQLFGFADNASVFKAYNGFGIQGKHLSRGGREERQRVE